MNLFLKFGAAGLAFGLCATPALAQSTASAPANATTTIAQPLTITNTAPMAFGTVVRPSTDDSTITIGEDADTATATGDAMLLGTTSRAKFSIAGEGGQTVTVTVPLTFDLTLSGGSDTLEVALNSDIDGSTTLSGTAGAEGTAALNVGGEFTVADDTPIGSYSGSFDVTVAYQ